MKKILFLLIGFFILASVFSSAALAQTSCTITFDPSKATYSTTEGITIKTANVTDNTILGVTTDKHRIIIKDSTGKQIRDFCDTTAALQGKSRVLGNFSAGTYSVSIGDRCIPGDLGIQFCDTKNFTTKSTAVTTGSKMTISANPQKAAYGDAITITLANIPTDDNSQAIAIRTAGQDRTGGGNLGALEVDVSSGKCDVVNATDLFTSFATPVCNDAGGSFEVVAQINTKNLGIPATDTTDHTYNVNLTTQTNVGTNFTVAAPQQNSSAFSIQDLAPNPAKPGDTVAITIANAKEGTIYTYGVRGPTSAFQQDTCEHPDCTLSLKLATAITSPQVDVLVRDANGVEKTAQLSITLLTPVVSQVVGTDTPAPSVPLPCVKKDSSGNCSHVYTALGIIPTNPTELLTFIFGILLSVSGGIALMLIIFSGYQIMISEGNPEKIQAARDTITSAIIGLVFMIFSLVVLQIIGVQILRIPGFS